MYPFIETIRIEDGQIYNLDYHTERFNRTRAVFWKDSVPLDLCKYISPPVLNGIHKCRIVYGKEVEEVSKIYSGLIRFNGWQILSSVIDHRERFDSMVRMYM